MSDILLSTLNARYIHSSLGLRYLYANLGVLQEQAEIREFIIDKRPIDIAEQLLNHSPKIIGLGVYIWNVTQTTELVKLLKKISPETTIILGGPEVSYENQDQEICLHADYVMSGQADLQFAELCHEILSGKPPKEKFINCLPFKLNDIQLPYAYYSKEDVKNRVIYVEASRGCPFKCEFCLSALDKTAVPFDQEVFLQELDNLYQRGVRQFKFVDRTFNLKVQASIRILEFFLEKNDKNLFVHFELIPDHLPDKLKEVIKQFPAGSLQFEIGIQSFNPQVQQLISRKQNNEKSMQNIRWLSEETETHLHTDLIIGLPGETLESIGKSFDQLISLKPHEIQVGILKRLKGTPILRHTAEFDMRYNPQPPFNILSNSLIDFNTMQRLWRFSRYWDMIGNSGRFSNTLPIILGDTPFERFLQLSDWIFANTEQTHKISLPRLFNLLFKCLKEFFKQDESLISESMGKDYENSGLKGYPDFLKQLSSSEQGTSIRKVYTPQRQARHMRQ